MKRSKFGFTPQIDGFVVRDVKLIIGNIAKNREL